MITLASYTACVWCFCLGHNLVQHKNGNHHQGYKATPCINERIRFPVNYFYNKNNLYFIVNINLNINFNVDHIYVCKMYVTSESKTVFFSDVFRSVSSQLPHCGIGEKTLKWRAIQLVHAYNDLAFVKKCAQVALRFNLIFQNGIS